MPVTQLPPPPSRADAGNFADRADAFLPALVVFGAELNTVADEVNANADAAALAAATALNTPSTAGHSTTSLAIGTGAKTLTIETDKNFFPGQFVLLAATPGNWMHGQVTAYDAGAGALTVQVGSTSGTGTFATWVVGLSAPVVTQAAATAADIRAGTSNSLAVTPAGLAEAQDFVDLQDGATITPDLSAGLNFRVTIAGNRMLALPLGLAGKEGTNFTVRVTQGPGGNKALTHPNGTVKIAGGAPTLSTSAGLTDLFVGTVMSATRVEYTFVKGIPA
jgi:hypothetical protein